MQNGLPYKTRATPPPSSAATDSDESHPPPPESTNNPNPIRTETSAKTLVAENSLIIFGRRGCCLCHVAKRLLLGLGANPPVVEVDEDQEAAVIGELSGGQGMEFPAVFIGGKLFGGLERVMATHISGELVPSLKQAGALWL